MTGARLLVGTSAVAAAGLLLLALTQLSCAAAAAAGDERHNVLEAFPTARLRQSAVGRRSKGAISITYNATSLSASGEWVGARGRAGGPVLCCAAPCVPPPLPGRERPHRASD